MNEVFAALMEYIICSGISLLLKHTFFPPYLNIFEIEMHLITIGMSLFN